MPLRPAVLVLFRREDVVLLIIWQIKALTPRILIQWLRLIIFSWAVLVSVIYAILLRLRTLVHAKLDLAMTALLAIRLLIARHLR